MLLRRQKVLAMATSAHDPKHQSRVTRATEYSIGARIERSVRYSTVVSRFVLFDIEGPPPERATESIASNHSLIQPLMIVNTSLSSCCQHARIKKNSKPMRFAAQIRAARALLGWSQTKLARSAGVGLATLQRLEQSDGVVKGNFATVLKIQRALEGAGISFSGDSAEEIGVRLLKKKS